MPNDERRAKEGYDALQAEWIKNVGLKNGDRFRVIADPNTPDFWVGAGHIQLREAVTVLQGQYRHTDGWGIICVSDLAENEDSYSGLPFYVLVKIDDE